jgi:hypothetical protein
MRGSLRVYPRPLRPSAVSASCVAQGVEPHELVSLFVAGEHLVERCALAAGRGLARQRRLRPGCQLAPVHSDFDDDGKRARASRCSVAVGVCHGACSSSSSLRGSRAKRPPLPRGQACQPPGEGAHCAAEAHAKHPKNTKRKICTSVAKSSVAAVRPPPVSKPVLAKPPVGAVGNVVNRQDDLASPRRRCLRFSTLSISPQQERFGQAPASWLGAGRGERSGRGFEPT